MPPINDDWADAIEIVDSGSDTGTTTAATHETDDPLYDRIDAFSECTVWYKYVATGNGTLAFSTTATYRSDDIGEFFLHRIAAYTGASVSALSEEAYDHGDDIPPFPATQTGYGCSMVVSVVEGETYYIEVGGYLYYEGDFSFEWIATVAGDGYGGLDMPLGVSLDQVHFRAYQ